VNYLSLVSMLSDKVGGQAFVTEYAKPTSTLIQQIESSRLPPPEIQPEAAPAREALLRVLGSGSFTTRMYARMSAEEMLDDRKRRSVCRPSPTRTPGPCSPCSARIPRSD